MKLLLISPDISTPYTEGRKRFVLDLVDGLKNQHDTFLLTTTKKGQKTNNFDCDHNTSVNGHSLFHLFSLTRRLKKIIRDEQPDIVCLFPYGTFRHVYGLVNKWFIHSIQRICSQSDVPCLTIMYSIDEHITVEELNDIAPHLAVSSKIISENNHIINIGIQTHKNHFPRNIKGQDYTILFMAGMWEQTKKRVDHVINTRGLGLLLKAGEKLSHHKVRFIIASPLFASNNCKNQVLNHPLNTWNTELIEFRTEVKVPDIYHECDLFVFPYQKNITQFTPTSVLEAMSTGTCVALSDFPFMNTLANNGQTAHLFPANNHDIAAQIILTALSNKKHSQNIGKKGQQYIKRNWSIENSVKQLVQVASDIVNHR
jgi:glycosyltransferase involved in cell wall biosynthesis